MGDLDPYGDAVKRMQEEADDAPAPRAARLPWSALLQATAILVVALGVWWSYR